MIRGCRRRWRVSGDGADRGRVRRLARASLGEMLCSVGRKDERFLGTRSGEALRDWTVFAIGDSGSRVHARFNVVFRLRI